MSGSIVATGCLAWMLATPSPARAQDGASTPMQAAAADAPPPKVAPADAAAKLTGVWQLNTELSSGLSSDAGQQSAGGQGYGGGGGRGRGGGRGGGGLGGLLGGRGGFGGGGGSRGGGMSADQRGETDVVMAEMRQMPARLTIVAAADKVTLTSDDGVSRTFAINGKKESIDYGLAKVDTKTAWDNDALTFEIGGSPLKLSERYQITTDGSHLVISYKVSGGRKGSGGGSSSGVPDGGSIKHVYDPVPK